MLWYLIFKKEAEPNVMCNAFKCEVVRRPLPNALSASPFYSWDFTNVLNIDLYPGRYIFVELSFKRADLKKLGLDSNAIENSNMGRERTCLDYVKIYLWLLYRNHPAIASQPVLAQREKDKITRVSRDKRHVSDLIWSYYKWYIKLCIYTGH